MPGYFQPPMSPDWVIVGVTMEHGVSLFASKTLDRADFEIDYGDDHIEFRGHYIAPARHTRITLTCVMRDFVWVQAQDYGTAFSKLDGLFRQWAQEYDRQGQRIVIGAPRRSLVARPQALPPGSLDPEDS